MLLYAGLGLGLEDRGLRLGLGFAGLVTSLIKLSLCYSIVHDGAQWYEKFLEVDRLYRDLAWFSSIF